MSYESGVAALLIHKTEPSDSDTYRCEAFNALGKCATTEKLTIHSKYYRIITVTNFFFFSFFFQIYKIKMHVLKY